MAYISQQDEEEQDKLSPQTLSSGGGVSAGGNAASSAPPPTASRFVNFSRILNANRDVANRTADQLVSGVNAQGAAVEQQVTDFNNRVKAAQPPPAPAPSPVDSEEDFGPFVPRRSSPIPSGPTQAEADALKAEADKLKQSTDLTATSGGVGALIQQQVRGPYSDSARRLDSALIGGSAADKFAQARDRFGNLSNTINGVPSAPAPTGPLQLTEQEVMRRRRQRLIDRDKGNNRW